MSSQEKMSHHAKCGANDLLVCFYVWLWRHSCFWAFYLDVERRRHISIIPYPFSLSRCNSWSCDRYNLFQCSTLISIKYYIFCNFVALNAQVLFVFKYWVVFLSCHKQRVMFKWTVFISHLSFKGTTLFYCSFWTL